MSKAAAARRAVIYARVSVTQDESVSIERQIESAQQYAAARGWKVAGTYTDDGVSATYNRPDQRTAWRALLDSAESYDTVIVWKIDRLARKVMDFLRADETLSARGAGLVAVEQPIDMTTPAGRMFAQQLAIFAEYEAAEISARVKAARDHLLKTGRVVGGTVPYGWRSVPNPNGPGMVRVQDPDRIGYVFEAAQRALRGETLYSIAQWLNEMDAPLPTTSQANRKRTDWHYGTVERLLRNPVLAGMTAFNPGNRTKERGTEVLRDADGLPVVDESMAILSVADWRALVRRLDERDSPQTRPRKGRSATPDLLSGLVQCGHCTDDDGNRQRMWRATASGGAGKPLRPGYKCPQCRQFVARVDEHVVEQFLWAKGERVRWSVVEEVHEGGAAVLPEIEQRLSELTAALQATDDDNEADRLSAAIANLRRMRREARAESPQVSMRAVRETQTYGDDWADATDTQAQRAVLDDALEAVVVKRGKAGGRGVDTSRFAFVWRFPDEVGPIEVPDDATLAEWAASTPGA